MDGAVRILTLQEEKGRMERLLTPREAAELVAVAPRTIKEWLRRGSLPGLKVGSLWRIRQSDLESFVGREKSPSPAGVNKVG
jgi:excisionase family DNA binding protein